MTPTGKTTTSSSSKNASSSKTDPDLESLMGYVAAKHPLVLIQSADEDYVIQKLLSVAIDLKREPWFWNSFRGLRHGLVRSDELEVKDTSHPAGAMTWLLDNPADRLVVLKDLSDFLTANDPTNLRLLRELVHDAQRREQTVILLDHNDKYPSIIRNLATQWKPSLPDEDELHIIARDTLRSLNRDKKVSITLTRRQWGQVIRNLRGLDRMQAARIVRDAVWRDHELSLDDINHMLAAKRQAIGSDGLLEFVETPTNLDQIGGLSHLKRWLKMRGDVDELEPEELEKAGLSHPRGVLLLGVQGAGKSLCAKAIATAWQRPLLRLDPGTLYGSYIGESEKRLRDALDQAEAMSPIVLWIDEIEKGFASAASRSIDGGLSQRMFGTLLTWMQDHKAPVFMVATANNIDALPPELLRKGRFDEIFFVDLPKAAARKQILKIHLKKRHQDADKFDLKRLADASDGYSGAEIEQAIVSALHEAHADKAKLNDDMIESALTGSPPLSVVMGEKIAKLRAWAKDRCVMAD